MIILKREIYVLKSGVACARTVGSLQTICSFTAIMHIVYGCWCFVCLDYIGLWLRGSGFTGLLERGLRPSFADLWGQFYYASFYYLERLFGIECSPSELKLFLLGSGFDWRVALSGHSFSTLEEFLDICNFR